MRLNQVIKEVMKMFDYTSYCNVNEGCIQKKGASLKSLLSHLCEELEEN